MGSPESKFFVQVWIAKQIHEEDYVGKRLEYQLTKTVDAYKKKDAKIIGTELEFKVLFLKNMNNYLLRR